MSALRVGHGVYVDPWTHMEITGPEPLPVTEPSPVIRRRATPEELARLDCPDSPPRIIDAIGLVPRPIRGRLTDAEREERKRHRLAGSEATRKRAAEIRTAERGIARAARQAERDAIRAVREIPDHKPRSGPAQRVSDDAVLSAIRDTGGNVKAAERVVGITAQAIRQRLGVLERRGLLPADVGGMVTGRGHRRPLEVAAVLAGRKGGMR